MKTSSSVILIALAVADSLVLFVDLMDDFLYNGFDIYVEIQHIFLCKTVRYCIGVFNYIAVYYLVTFTVFRVITVYSPHKINVYCTRRRAFIAVTVTFIIMCLINLEYIHIQYIHDEDSDASDIICWFVGSWADFHNYYTEYVSLVVRIIIPFSVLIVGNSIIIYKIIQSNAQRLEMTQTVKQNTDDSQSMTAMLISISILFLVKQTPYIITNHIGFRLNYDSLSPEYEHGFYLLQTFTRLLKFVNNVANFFCYCISGKRFKFELVAMVRGWFRMRGSLLERNSILSTVSSTIPNSSV